MHPDFWSFYNKLNEEQKVAVDTIEGPVMVLAGPGTGKTQTIALRIGKILQETQVEPYNILCLTFTETAVTAMRNRLISIIGPSAHQVKIHSFHSFCNEVIKSNREKFPELGSNADAISEIEKYQLLESLIEKLDTDNILKPFGNNLLYIGDISATISRLKREAISPEKFEESITSQIEFFSDNEQAFHDLKALNHTKLNEQVFLDFLNSLGSTHSDHVLTKELNNLVYQVFNDELERENKKAYTTLRKNILNIYTKNSSATSQKKQLALVSLYQEYQSTLRAANKYDFEDMIMFTVDAFNTDQVLLQSYQELYQYILVDEYQDTNSAQNKTVELLCNFYDSPNIFVVGDDDQAVFRFQGASMDNILEFYHRYKPNGLKIITLTKNYRSQQLVLDSSYQLISSNSSSIANFIDNIDKKLVSQKDYPLVPLEQIIANTPTAENYLIAQEIKKLLTEGIPPAEIAIIFRDNKDANDLIEMLSKSDIPFSLTRGASILQDTEIQKLLWLLRFLIEPDYNHALFRILNFKFLQLNSLDLVKLYQATKRRIDLSALVLDPDLLATLKLTNPDQITELVAKLADWSQQAKDTDPVIFFTNIIQDSGFMSYILTLENKFELLAKLNRLYDELKQHAATDASYTMSSFLHTLDTINEYKIKLEIITESNKTDSVQLMTAHSAKGMEYQYVFITKLINKKWGNKKDNAKITLPIGLITSQLIVDKNEDERRLFYVALTRAEKKVYLCTHSHDEQQKEITPSLFLAELNQNLLSKSPQNNVEDAYLASLQVILGEKPKIDWTTAGKEYIRKLVTNQKLTVTNLNSYQACPRCYLLNNVLRIPKVKTRSLVLGTAIHNTLKDLVQQYSANGNIMSVEALQTRFTHYLSQEIIAQAEYQEILNNGLAIIESYAQEAINNLHENSLAEYDFMKHDIYLDNIPLTGKIDRIDIIDEKKGIVKVIDYKTGNPDSKSKQLNQEKMGDYYKQLVFYKLLIELSTHTQWHVEKGSIDFIEKSKKKEIFIRKEYAIDAEEIEKLKLEIKSVAASIYNLEFERFDDKNCHSPELHSLPILI